MAQLSIDRTTRLPEAARQMLDAGVESLFVTAVDQNHEQHVSGIVTERDLVQALPESERAQPPAIWTKTNVNDIMKPSAQVVAVHPDDSLQKCIEMMSTVSLAMDDELLSFGVAQGLVCNRFM